MTEALDIMVRRGWVRGYVRDVKRGIVVDWTDDGRLAIETLWDIFSLLGGRETQNKEIWWTVTFIAMLHAQEGPDS
jgi:hypothetical protein